MFTVFNGRSCINPRNPSATIDEARQYVRDCIAGLRRNGIGNPDATWIIADSSGHPVERLTESAA